MRLADESDTPGCYADVPVRCVGMFGERQTVMAFSRRLSVPGMNGRGLACT